MSGEEPRVLVEEQAALRRVATLVAGVAAPEEVFAAVTEEVGQLLPVDFAIMGRYEADGQVTAIAAWGIPVADFPLGRRWGLGGKNVVTIVHETGRPARIDGYADTSSGPIGVVGRESGFQSTVGTPIVVEGRLWGVMAVGSTLREPPLPATVEARLEQFTELLETAIANAESRTRLAQLAEQQAALRRVATLVARGVPQEQLFTAVTEEIGRRLPVEYAFMGRYEPDEMFAVVAVWGSGADRAPVGSRQSLGGKNLVTIVFETGRSARMDDFADASGPLGVLAHETGVRSAVGTPILVEGRLWGVVIAGSTVEDPLPGETEAGLVSFTELLATAIANAESRAGLAQLAEEQAALRRVATLVARGVPPEEVFAAVVEEVGQLLRVASTGMGRYDVDGKVTVVAAWGTPVASFPVGSRWGLEGENLVTIVLETGRPTRVDRFTHGSGPVDVAGRESGVRSAVGAPIVVEGRPWGLVIAGSSEEQPLPADTEARLASFTELVATAIANAESRSGLARLAEEQAALRRVATLVARGLAPAELFAAVTDEVVGLLPVDFAHMGRYEPDGAITVLAASGSTAERFPVGRRWSLGGKNLTTIVYETGRPARIDGYADAFGALGDTGRELGIRSSAGTPIVVEGEVWGVVIAGSTLDQSLPADIEARLGSFTELVATAVANAESRVALTASRTRIVAAADESRRRIERDLHDGAQQRLVHAVIVLKLALRALSNGDADAGELVSEALRHAEQANSELRELAHGILPAALTRGGLRAGVEALVSRVSLPVSLEVSVERLPASVEATAYFVVSEALTNVVKHARAGGVRVAARVERGELRVEVRDDGVGGARGGHGTGLGGLEDRVSALDGRLVLESPPGGGTLVCALLPVSDQG